jgi:hypothetical protein
VLRLTVNLVQPSKYRVTTTGEDGFDISFVSVARQWKAALSRKQRHFRQQQISFPGSRLIGVPKSQKISGIARFAGNAQLPCNAARIPAAQ